MVDGRYWGRGAVTKEQLSDAQVREIFKRRSRARGEAAGLLDQVIRRDPTPPRLQEQAHLFVLAHPLFAPGDLLLRAFGGASGDQWLGNKVLHGEPAQFPSRWAPDLVPNASNVSRRARGWALHSYEMGPDRSVRKDEGPAETGLLDLKLDENGTLRLFCGRGSDVTSSRRVVFEALIAGLTRRLVVTASVVAQEGGYFGPWSLGLALTNLRGAVSWFMSENLLGHGVAYSENDYRMTTEASFEDLRARPDDVVERLFGRLNRALNGGHFAPTSGMTPGD